MMRPASPSLGPGTGHLFGYPDRFSVRAGESLGLHISSAFPEVAVDVVRIFQADPNPAGPGLRMRPATGFASASVNGRRQPVMAGSYMLAEHDLALEHAQEIALGAAVWPTRLDDTPSWIIRMESAGFVIALGMTRDAVVLEVGKDHDTVQVTMPMTLTLRRWASIEARLLTRTGEVRFNRSHQTCGMALPIGSALRFGQICVAGSDGRGCFDGKIEAPFISQQSAGGWSDVARWDFSRGIDTDRAEDTGPLGLHGSLINAPLRAVTGMRWTGEEMCWRHLPEHYGAIRFHTDDLADCRWPESLRLPIPGDCAPGIYGARLRAQGAEDIVPFVVRSPQHSHKPRIAFLMPTFTYMAYANVSFGHSAKPEYKDRVARWGANRVHADDHPEFGRSMYNQHGDGSGIAMSSRLRPILNFRPGALHIFDSIGSGVRHFVADMHLIDWLGREGFACEILTDEDLDDEGIAALDGNDIVLTGTHPEYHTEGTLDALEAFKQRGGRLAYLGGNGFYWRVARSAERPHLIELRRAEGGVRAWETQPGESYHATDGTYGGLWRRCGRPPQHLVGVGFSALGGYEAKPYRRCAASYEDRYAWLFEGIEDELIGERGLTCGGAAGYEIDRADPALGTPGNATILATSAGERYVTFSPAPEDVLAPGLSGAYGSPDDLVRADMVYFDTPSGGAVFAAGSITFCGALMVDAGQNSISRLLRNLLHHWSAGEHARPSRTDRD